MRARNVSTAPRAWWWRGAAVCLRLHRTSVGRARSRLPAGIRFPRTLSRSVVNHAARNGRSGQSGRSPQRQQAYQTPESCCIAERRSIGNSQQIPQQSTSYSGKVLQRTKSSYIRQEKIPCSSRNYDVTIRHYHSKSNEIRFYPGFLPPCSQPINGKLISHPG